MSKIQKSANIAQQAEKAEKTVNFTLDEKNIEMLNKEALKLSKSKVKNTSNIGKSDKIYDLKCLKALECLEQYGLQEYDSKFRGKIRPRMDLFFINLKSHFQHKNIEGINQELQNIQIYLQEYYLHKNLKTLKMHNVRDRFGKSDKSQEAKEAYEYFFNNVQKSLK